MVRAKQLAKSPYLSPYLRSTNLSRVEVGNFGGVGAGTFHWVVHGKNVTRSAILV